MGRRISAERIFLLAFAGSGWLLRRFPQRQSVFALRFLRAGDRAEIFPHRHLRIHEQGIRRDEADTVFFLRRHVCVHRDSRRLRDGRLVGFESVGAIPISTATPIVGVSGIVYRVCSARRHLAAAHLGADWPCRCTHCGFDVARRDRHETWVLRGSARGDESFPARISNVEQMDRCPRGHRNCIPA